MFWGGLMLGRVVFGLLPSTLRPGSLLRGSIVGVCVAAGVLTVGFGIALNLAAVFVLGFSSGPIFPSLIATTAERVGDAHTANTVGFQVAAAALGQSLLPTGVGVLADRFGLEVVPASVLIAGLVLFAICQLMGRPRAALLAAPAA